MTSFSLTDEQIRALANAWTSVCGRIMDGSDSEAIADQVVFLFKDTWAVIEASGWPPHPTFRLLQHRPVEVEGRPYRRKFSYGLGFGPGAAGYDSLTHAAALRELVAELLERAEEFYGWPVNINERLLPAE